MVILRVRKCRGSRISAVILAALSITALSIGGCGTAPLTSGPPGEPRSSGSATAADSLGDGRETERGGYFVTCRSEPSPIPLNRMFALTVTVRSGTDREKRLTDVAVEVDAAMPDHHHGMNLTPTVTPGRDGEFIARGMLFHMPGHWELYIDVKRGEEKERCRFDVHLR